MRIPAIGLFLAALAGCATTDPEAPGLQQAQLCLDEGRDEVKRGEWELAINSFTKAARANPELAEAYHERGKCNVRLRLSPDTTGDVQVYEKRAIEDFTLAIQKNPALGDAYYNRAMLLCARAQYKPAVEDLLNAVRFAPRDPEPHLWLGKIYESKFEDRMPLALDHFEKYVDLGGTDSEAREKVRAWKEFKRQATSPLPQSNKPSSPEDERKAQEQHSKAMELLKNPDKSEAVKALEELIGKYGHTKYVQERSRALQAAVAAFKKKDAPK